MIPPVAIEISVLVLGLVVLMFETFASQLDKRVVGLVTIFG